MKTSNYKYCQAIAKSTREPCKKRILPGSKYCIFHVEKTPIFISTVIGVMLTIAVSYIVPSPLEKKIEPFMKLAKSRYPSEENNNALMKLLDDFPTMDNKINELVDGKNKLIEINNKLSTDISIYQNDLNEKELIITELEQKVKLAKKGIGVYYTYSGKKKITKGPGFIDLVTDTPENQAFKKMEQLDRSHNINALIVLCNEQIKCNPDWLTPYYVLGQIQVRNGNYIEAIKNLEYVIKNDPYNKEYAKASELIKEIRSQQIRIGK